MYTFKNHAFVVFWLFWYTSKWKNWPNNNNDNNNDNNKHWEQCKKFKFHHMNKWYMYNTESVQENGMRFWDTNGSFNLSQTTRPYNNQKKKKKNLQNCGLCCPGWPQSKVERKWKERQVLRPCLRIEKTVEHESDGCTNCDWFSRYSHQRIGKTWNERTTIQTTTFLKSPRILRRVLKTCYLSVSSEIPSADTDVKNSRGVKNNMTNKKKLRLP